VQHVLEGSRHGGGLRDSGSDSGSGSGAVVRVVGAIEGLQVVAQVLSGLVQKSVIQATHGSRHMQRRGSIVGFVCVVSKRIVKVSLLLGGTAGLVAFDNHGQGASWTIKRARQGACIAGAFGHSLNDAGRGDRACNKADLSLMRLHAAFRVRLARLSLPSMSSRGIQSMHRVNALTCIADTVPN
jgi:hypothetical protein